MIRTRVFFRPMSVSPFRSSISEFRSLRIPAQSMLSKTSRECFLYCLLTTLKEPVIYLLKSKWSTFLAFMVHIKLFSRMLFLLFIYIVQIIHAVAFGRFDTTAQSINDFQLISRIYLADMLFSGRSGISSTLVLFMTVSWLAVETVLPVILCTW